MFLLEFHKPPFPLNEYIELFTYYEGYDPAHQVERLLPEGVVEIIIDLTESAKYIYDNQTLKQIQSCNQAWVSGLRTSFISITAGPMASMFIIRFYPGKAWPFLQIPISEIQDYIVDADLIFGEEIALLREALLYGKSLEEKFKLAENYFLRKAGHLLNLHPAVGYGIREIISAPSLVSIKKIVQKTGYTHKHFISMFNKYVGLNPKQFLQIIKFQQAIRAIENCKTINWTHLAIDCGYYDQAHFINDFKKFSGFNPSSYIEVKGEFINYIPIK